jgi:type IV secretory pathway VirB3-like protein
MGESVIHASLNRPALIMGISAKAFMLEMGLAVIALNLRVWLLMAMVVPMHIFLRWTFRRDEIVLNAYFQYQKEADVYDPWVRQPIAGKRPEGFGEGLHC